MPEKKAEKEREITAITNKDKVLLIIKFFA